MTTTPVKSLHLAAWYGDKAALARLLRAGADINAKDKHGKTPLHYAAMGKRKDTSVASTLLANGADPSPVTGKRSRSGGSTPLHFAVLNEDIPLIRLLIKNGAKVEIKDTDGMSPPAWAHFLRFKAAARVLGRKGGNFPEPKFLAKTNRARRRI